MGNLDERSSVASAGAPGGKPMRAGKAESEWHGVIEKHTKEAKQPCGGAAMPRARELTP